MGNAGSSPRMRGTLSAGMFGLRIKTVHPRACGEHHIRWRRLRIRCGSSPRMRGTLCHRSKTATHRRFIPAHAGNTCTESSSTLWMCGSSPRMRGTRSPPPWPYRCRAVHPRACGEHLQESDQLQAQGGSSPRMRGTHDRCGGREQLERFIPAHAGNTPQLFALQACLPVHPRACGEHTGSELWRQDALGSSPRMRGTRIPRIV